MRFKGDEGASGTHHKLQPVLIHCYSPSGRAGRQEESFMGRGEVAGESSCGGLARHLWP